MQSVAAAASAIQGASDEPAVLEAMSAAVDFHGLDAQIALLDAAGEVLVVRRLVVPCAAQAQMDAIHGGTIVGMRTTSEATVDHWAAVRSGMRMHAAEALAWIVRPAPDVEPARKDAVASFIGLGEAYLTPITDGRRMFGVLTVWAPRLERRDRATAMILGRLGGDALAAQQLPGAAPTSSDVAAASRPAKAPEVLAA
jgi:hypothetical protein